MTDDTHPTNQQPQTYNKTDITLVQGIVDHYRRLNTPRHIIDITLLLTTSGLWGAIIALEILHHTNKLQNGTRQHPTTNTHWHNF